MAANGSLSSDPEPSSPAAKFYEIPLETARQDAAPRKAKKDASTGAANTTSGGGGAAGGGSGNAGESVGQIHSENGFGSSTTVPGTATKAAVHKTAGTAKPVGSVANSGNGGSGSSEAQAPAPSSGTASPSGALLLLGLTGLLGAGLGVMAARGLRDLPR